MSRMTLSEKIGQLNLQVAGDITTGQAQNTQVAGIIRAGGMGGVFNLKGVEKVKEMQKIAVEQSRLGIPLLVGMDVIHGYETIFPIPLALSCSWDVDAVEEAARIAAKEASADGVNWVFSRWLTSVWTPAGGALPKETAKTRTSARSWPGP